MTKITNELPEDRINIDIKSEFLRINYHDVFDPSNSSILCLTLEESKKLLYFLKSSVEELEKVYTEKKQQNR